MTESGDRVAFRLAILCGLIPLVAGGAIFLLWLATRWEWLMAAGLLTIVLGNVSFLVGLVALWMSSRSARVAQVQTRGRRWRELLALLLLVANYPAACGIVGCVAAIEARVTVTVQNLSAGTLDDVRISGGGCGALLGPMEPGVLRERSLKVEEEGRLVLEVTRGGVSSTECISERVVPGAAGGITVTVNPDGTITVVDEAMWVD